MMDKNAEATKGSYYLAFTGPHIRYRAQMASS